MGVGMVRSKKRTPLAGVAASVGLGSRLYGFDRYAYDLTTALAISSRKITLAIEASYIVSTSLTKISILLFYRRMAEGSISTRFRTIVFASIAFVAAYAFTFLITLFFGCRPLSATWNEVDITWAARRHGSTTPTPVSAPLEWSPRRASILVRCDVFIVRWPAAPFTKCCCKFRNQLFSQLFRVLS